MEKRIFIDEFGDLEIDFSMIVDRLKKNFTSEQLREISFSIDTDSEDIVSAFFSIESEIREFVESGNKYQEFYIEEKVKEICEYLNSDIEYRKTEEYCADYFMEIPNSEIYINNQTYDKEFNVYYTRNSNYTEKIKNIVEPLLNTFDYIGIDHFEFNYYDMGTPFYNPTEQIYFHIACLGELEIELSDDHCNLIDNPDIGEKIKNEVENSASVFINESFNNKYAYYDASYDSMVYGISYNGFLTAIFDNYDIEDMNSDDKKNIAEFVELVGKDEFDEGVLKIVSMLK